ncbi:GNAT family N-acetyltransferase [Chitinophaga pendula]|uniref:GNAT family N-acetyltransferase n=1 Tax=Chitinophaga TaxID=79328 RepID=UPI000BAE7F59|nr:MULTISPECIES: GNAT family N-acetyltransferase [Chitinophaga]ASZ09591.1 GNAT family N-acetyltransferase [Chitinophaga sp. MD30]UCJ07475.1 GNAT family N-acetyltransferase [Chitinophaga pendula]
MKRAEYNDKNLVVDILTKSFDANQSVNYIIKQDQKRVARIRSLMDYSFEMCSAFGDVFLSDDNKACALIVYPDKKKSTPKSTLLDLKLILQAVGIGNISKTLKREKMINSIQPKIPMSYLWFIGVDPTAQGRRIGSALLQEIIDYSNSNNRPIYLETSTVKNLPWYEKFGFEVYNEQDLTYHLYFFKRDVK